MNLWIIGTMIAGIFSLYTLIFYKFQLYSNTIWKTFTESVYNLSAIALVAQFVIGHWESVETSTINDLNRLVHDQERGFIEIERLIMGSYPESLRLYRQMNTQNTIIQALPDHMSVDRTKRHIVESTLANIIFQNIEITLLSLTEIGKLRGQDYRTTIEYREWVQVWSNWLKSEILQAYWKINGNLFYSPRTVEFVNRELLKDHS